MRNEKSCGVNWVEIVNSHYFVICCQVDYVNVMFIPTFFKKRRGYEWGVQRHIFSIPPPGARQKVKYH